VAEPEKNNNVEQQRGLQSNQQHGEVGQQSNARRASLYAECSRAVKILAKGLCG